MVCIFLILLVASCQSDPPAQFTYEPLSTSEAPPMPSPTTPGLRLGQVVSATGIDDAGCPVGITNNFPEDTLVIYVVVPDSDVPQGNEIFARLYHNGTQELDTQTVYADQDYENTCIIFEFTYDRSDGFFRRGEYSAQIYVNDTLVDSSAFVVR